MGNRHIQVVRPVNKVYGQCRLPLHDRPRVVGAFFDAEQGAATGIIIVTCFGLENFSPKNGFLKHSLVVKEPSLITCSNFNPTSSLGSVVFTGCKDETVRIYESEKFNFLFSLECGMPSGSISMIPSVLLCPLNNALVCGFEQGCVKAFFLENKALAGTYERQKANTEPQGHYSPVASLSFCKQKNWLVAGDSKDSQNTTQSVPLVVYNLQKCNCVKIFYGCTESILASNMTPDLRYMIACTALDLLVWNGSSDELLYRYDFGMNLYTLEPHNKCRAAHIEAKEGILFTVFDVGRLAALEVTLPDAAAWGTVGDKENSMTHGSASTRGIPVNPDIDIRCEAIRMLQCRNESTDASTNQHVMLQNSCPLEYLWYDNRTQTIVVGDNKSSAKLIPDFFGRQALTPDAALSNHEAAVQSMALPVVAIQQSQK